MLNSAKLRENIWYNGKLALINRKNNCDVNFTVNVYTTSSAKINNLLLGPILVLI
jgi:hypothetical protein